MPDQLASYLRNHEAVATASFDLARRTLSNQRARAYAEDLRGLVAELRDDLGSLRSLMSRAGVQPDRVLGTALRLGERAGRLKPNGHLIRRAPLSDLVEIEAMLDAAYAKVAGWQSIRQSRLAQGSDLPVIESVLQRSQAQAERLVPIHRTVATEVLGG